MRRTLLLSLLAALFTAGAIGSNITVASAAPLGYTVDLYENHALFAIDLGTGAATEVGPTNATTIEGLTLACNGTLYGIDSEVDELVTINTGTGALSTVGDLNTSSTDGGLTFGTDGTLYLAAHGSFYRVDTTSGNATFIGSFGGELSIVGLATHPNGTIYGVERFSHRLYTIDPATGVATEVGNAAQNPVVNGIDFDASGTLWGLSMNSDAPQPVVTFDLTTGVASPAGTLSNGHGNGLAIAPICPPVNSTTTSSTSTSTSSSTSTTTSTSTSTTTSTVRSTTTTTRPPAAAAIQAQPVFVG